MLIVVFFALVALVIGWYLMRRIQRRWLRWLFLVPLLTALWVGVLASAVATATSQGRQAATIEILDAMLVERGELVVTVSGTGTIAPARQALLSFQLSAPVAAIMADDGAFVEAGAVIARLDPTDFELALAEVRAALEQQQAAFDALVTPPRASEIAVAEANLNAARASYSAATQNGTTQNDVEIARLQYELAGNQLWQTQLQRDQITDSSTVEPLTRDDVPQIVEDNLTEDQIQLGLDAANDLIADLNAQLSGQTVMQRGQAETAITQAEYGVAIADANYIAAQNRGLNYSALSSANLELVNSEIALNRLLNGPDEFDLRRAELDLERARLAVALAEANASQTELIAPFSGIIAENRLVVGELPPTQAPSVVLLDTRAYYVDLPIDETDIVKVAEGQRVVFTVDALPNAEITGKVVRVSYIPDRIGQLVTYIARVELDPTAEPIRVGMSATARIIVQELGDVLRVRNRFIRIDRATGEAFVTVQDGNGAFREVLVVLGQRNDDYSEIISGLQVGERIVLVPRGTVIPGISGGAG